MQMMRSGTLEFNVKTQAAIENIEFKVTGEPEASGVTLTLDAELHTANSINGKYLTHFVEPNTVYSVSVLNNNAHHNAQGDAFANIGLTYVNATDVKRLVSIDEKTVFISTQGEMSFFLTDSDEDNSGKVLVNIKRVNID